ncbi:MAG: segregation and condensation protein B [Candidatus Giovannonibacteria bacterium GW2011_GWA1_43_15]|nr:MAG: segregation and condensation protein B [Candidatus Giovannonibacteria bacterium GW2011_GWB1_43_13]KKS99066.1 MAG: segregation and condensation protein B [Candidatus Giovannonibacteria bacterium GW2011_GWA1_43_15]KKT21608.1 MAG: segregation and condensation protein B [Candidatus Giovannonibacteria bacterium GW2011_GWC2_43_8]
MGELAKKIEALLFVSGEGLGISRLSALTKKSDGEIKLALEELEKHLSREHFITILRDGDKISLVSSKEISKLVEDFAKEEFAGELTRAALETLTIIAYKGPVKRMDIDYIRGVNSSFIIRNLLMRGLIERVRNAKDSRTYLYRASTDFLKFFGLTSISQLPDYGSYKEKLDEIQ